MTFYLKYRSKTIDEMDLESVRLALANIIKSGNIPHAFLFSGPKGSGKTSAARIVAKVINCESTSLKLRGPGNFEPCNKCSNCLSIAKGENLDVIEIDAASHRGIDDIRMLRDAVKLAPASAKKKVYIIDEAHMLTTEASNALLKTLEEPPDHVVFILATTNPEKLIDTIRSRTMNILFTRAHEDEIVRSLSRVILGEKLKAEKEVLKLIASASDGSFRDAVKTLEELVIRNVKLEKKSVEEYLFSKNIFDPDKFINILKGDDEKLAYQEIEKAVESGASIKNITISLLERLRIILLAKVGILAEDKSTFTKDEVLDLIKLISRSYSEINYAVLEQIPLELAVSEWFMKKLKISGPKTITEGSPSEGDKKKKQSEINTLAQENSPSEQSANKDVLKNADYSNSFGDEVWAKILTEIRPKNTSTEALLRAAKPVGFDGKILTLGVYYKFHKERLETQPHMNILEAVLQSVTGDRVRVICTLTDPPLKKQEENEALSQDTGNSPGNAVNSEAVLTEGEDEEIIKVAKEIFGS